MHKVGIKYYICNLVAQKMYSIKFALNLYQTSWHFIPKDAVLPVVAFYFKQYINYGTYAYFRPCLSDMLSREETYTLIIF